MLTSGVAVSSTTKSTELFEPARLFAELFTQSAFVPSARVKVRLVWCPALPTTPVWLFTVPFVSWAVPFRIAVRPQEKARLSAHETFSAMVALFRAVLFAFGLQMVTFGPVAS